MDKDNWVLMLIFGALIGAAIVFFTHNGNTSLPVKSTLTYNASNPSNLTRTYKNLEEWEIERDVDGRLKNIKVNREAARSG
jgi:hypothetical protein